MMIEPLREETTWDLLKTPYSPHPSVVFREEEDNWALLFHADTGQGFGLDPTGIFIWRRLDGNHTPEDILNEMKEAFVDLPPEAKEHVKLFITEMKSRGLIREVEKTGRNLS